MTANPARQEGIKAIFRRPAFAVVATIAVAVVIFRDQVALQSAILGLGSGALIAAIALGVLLTFRGDGVVNFANGAIAMFAGYVYMDLASAGRIVVPPLPNPLAPLGWIWNHALGAHVHFPAWPVEISVSHHMAPAVAAIAVLVLAAVAGLLLHVVLFRWLRRLPSLAKVAATIGLMISLQAIVLIRFGSNSIATPSLLPSSTLRIGQIAIPYSQMILVLVICASAGVLAVTYRYSRFGIATRAAAESEKGAMLLRLSPNTLAAVNWTMSTVLTAGLGMLAASVNGTVDPTTMTLTIVPALAVVLLANFTSFGVAVAGGLGLGVAQSLIQYYGTKSWFPDVGGAPLPGLSDALPALIIIGVLIVRGSRLPTRGSEVIARLPESPNPQLPAICLTPAFLVVLVLCFVVGPDWRTGITNTLIGVLLALSLVVITGFVGQISFVQVGLSGAAAFALAHLQADWGVPFPVAPILAAVVAAGFGMLMSVAAVRIRGVNLAIVTLALAVALNSAVFGNPAVAGGLVPVVVQAPSLFGLRFGPGNTKAVRFLGLPLNTSLPSPWFGVFVLIVTAAVFLAVRGLRRSPTGRQMLAVRANESAAAALGINAVSVKVSAFGIAGFIAGLAGALFAYSFQGVPVDQFAPIASILLMAYAYIGGISSVGGALAAGTLAVGGVGAVFSQNVLGLGGNYVQYASGLFLLWFAVKNPDGVAGDLRRQLTRLREIGSRVATKDPGRPRQSASAPAIGGREA